MHGKYTRVLIVTVGFTIIISVAAVVSRPTLFDEETISLRRSISEDAMITFINDSDEPCLFFLEDSSSVSLQPNSQVKYPEKFSDIARVVYLDGGARFNVSRDPTRPFLVNTDHLLARVLGTSFEVRDYDGEDSGVVVVHSGKVSVMNRSKSPKSGNRKPQEVELLLTSNQTVVLDKDQGKLMRALVEIPEKVKTTSEHEFNYVDTPVSEIFRRLEEAYGVKVIFDEQTMASCLLNISLGNVSFHDKLRLICKGIDATYEIVDAQVIVSGNGCKEVINSGVPE